MDKKTGDIRWWAETPGRVKDTYYSTPVIAVINGQQGAVVLTSGSTMPAVTSAYLGAHPGSVFALGGPAAAADPAATAVVGGDRYDTATHVAARFFSGAAAVGVADGLNFPDALAGGAHIARRGGPLLLTDPSVLSAPTDGYLRANRSTIGAAYVYGGTVAVSSAVQAQIQSALSG